jgi:hypothetical protein
MPDAWGGGAALVKLAMLAYLGAHGEPLQAANVTGAVRAPVVVHRAAAAVRPAQVARRQRKSIGEAKASADVTPAPAAR